VSLEFIQLLGKVLIVLIALEAVSIVMTRKARVFPWLGRKTLQLGKWLWHKFWHILGSFLRWFWKNVKDFFSWIFQEQGGGP
jgi:hypothetical protein